MTKTTFWQLFLASLVLGLGVRLAYLDLRPMHHDEANQAVKFGALLETGKYQYDPNDHHGPTLYYLTLPAAWARGQNNLATLDEWTLRVVPAVFGAALILLLAPLAAGLGRGAIALGALFAALSPALTYYSRFYIQESLFAFFVLGFLLALGRYALRPTAGRALAAGVFAGLAFATKETSIIVLAAAIAAVLLEQIWASGVISRRRGFAGPSLAIVVQILAGTAAAVSVATVLYSSFFQNPDGIFDSVRAFKDYTARGIAEPGLHAHPWYYYLQTLAFSRSGGIVWTEGMILLLAVAGMLEALAGNRRKEDSDGLEPAATTVDVFWLRYIALYSLIAAAAFSILRYKTPWNLVPFYVGFVILAGCGATALLRRIPSRLFRGAAITILLAGICHLAIQNWQANFVYPADPRNPYVYAQTSPDFLRLVQRIHELSAVHADRDDMLIKVIAGPYEQWPLPWYLRDLRRVGYWADPPGAGELQGVPVIIASQENAVALQSVLADRYEAEFYGLRPEVPLIVFVERSLWERTLQTR